MSDWTNFLYKAIRLAYEATLMSALFNNQFIFTEAEEL